MRAVGFLKRHAVLIAIYGLLVLESLYRIVKNRSGLSSLRPEVLLGIGILAAYFLILYFLHEQRKNSEFHILFDRIHCGIAIICMDDYCTLERANPAFFRISEYTAEEFRKVLRNHALRLIPKEDLSDLLAEVKRRTDSSAHLHIDFRIKTKCQEIRWIHMDAFLFQEQGGQRIFQCIFTDISKLKASMEQAEMEAERFQIISRLSNEILFEYDFAKKQMAVTRQISDLLPSGQLTIPDFCNYIADSRAVHPTDLGKLAHFLRAADGEEKREEEIRLHLDGRYVWFRVEGSALKDHSRRPLKIIGKFSDIDDIKRENEDLHEKLQRDPMTGVYNKVVTERLIDRYLQGASAEENVSALFILDMDNFKYINDTFGHLAGDKILTHMVKGFQHILRSSDIFGRIGGDEFVLFAKNIQRQAMAREKAERLCQLFRSILLSEDTEYPVSGSIGIAMFPGDGRTYRELFDKADRALYATKWKGKGGYSFYHEETVPPSSNQMLAQSSGSHMEVYTNLRIISSLLAFLSEHCLDKNAIENMLAIICRYFKASRGSLLQFSEVSGKAVRVFTWNEPNAVLDVSRTLEHSEIYWKQYLAFFDRDAVFRCESLRKVGFLPEKGLDYVSLQHVAFRNQHLMSILALDYPQSFPPSSYHEIHLLKIVHHFLQCHLVVLQNMELSRSKLNIDSLTGIPTYEAFHTILNKALHENPDQKYALVSCDISHFSEINDLVGHDQGDQILVTLVSALRRQLQAGEYMGRVSADIFCILLRYEQTETLHDRVELWSQIFERQISPFRLPSSVQLICGVYPIQLDLESLAAMFDRANAARKQLKQTHIGKIQFYDDQMRKTMLFEKELEAYKAISLQNQDFVIYMQPKYNLADRKIAGAEALVRWNHPTLGLIQPASFIPMFERDHFIVDLDYYVLEMVCKTLRRWLDKGHPAVPIAVNFSRVHLLADDFVSRILQIVERYKINPAYLELELTESAFISQTFNVVKFADALRKYGFLVAMDDFGAGYSSLNSLKNLPFDILKLDKNFFQAKEPTPKETIIVENVVRLAKQLNLCVVSEGVEYEWQAEFLCSIDCDLAQGFLFSRPVPVRAFEKMLLELEQPALQYPPMGY